MTTQFANRISFFEPNGLDGRHHPSYQAHRSTVLVGIQRDTCPPLTFGATRLERMRIIVIAPAQAADFLHAEPDERNQDALTEMLPLLPSAIPPTRAPQIRPRQILGEILRGETGALYERFGNRIRPLRQLVSGPSGEVLEIPVRGESPPRLRGRVTAASLTEHAQEVEANRPEVDDDTSLSQTAPSRTPATDGTPKPSRAFRALFPEPGQWRVVRLGDFNQILVPQLVHPERLRNVHRLPCYVQVFEMTAPQTVAELAETLFGDAAATSQLGPLTAAIVQQLQLAPLLPAPSCPPRPATRQRGLLLPGDRVFYLEVANDPTDETRATESFSVPRKSHQTRSSRGDAAQTEKSEIGNRTSKIYPTFPTSAATSETRSQPGASLAAQPPQPGTGTEAPSPLAQPAASGPTHLKTSIPAQFLTPWEFRVTREEVLFDLIRARSLLGRLRAGLRRLTGGRLFNREFRTWQVSLTGKSLDEQLWAVRPPKGASAHPFIREWATRTLELAGYDSRSMLTEWQIFWRRKGD